MIWSDFINYFSENAGWPVVLTVLKQTSLGTYSDSVCVVLCDDGGTRMFLESKKEIVESSLSAFAKHPVSITLTVKENKRRLKKQQVELPLVEYQSRAEKIFKDSGLLSRYSFENFAVSNTNHIAHAAAKAVSERPGQIYNPFFIYGSVGVGKTHLAQAVANSIVKQDGLKRVLYCTSEEFTNDLVESIRQKNTKKTRNKYRSLDVLVVDDIQFIAGKTYVQEEFYHTFNTIAQNGGQIILSSDRPPKEMKELEDRLRSRFSGGLIIDIQKPDFELRTAILLIKAQERNIPIEMGAAQSLAQKIQDTRELEGALLKMLSVAIAENRDTITLESTNHELSQQQERGVRRVPPQEVIKTVATFYNLKQSDVKGARRTENIALARQVAMYILREIFGLNLNEVAFLLNRKDHSTIIHGVGRVRERIMKDSRFKENIIAITDQLL